MSDVQSLKQCLHAWNEQRADATWRDLRKRTIDAIDKYLQTYGGRFGDDDCFKAAAGFLVDAMVRGQAKGRATPATSTPPAAGAMEAVSRVEPIRAPVAAPAPIHPLVTVASVVVPTKLPRIEEFIQQLKPGPGKVYRDLADMFCLMRAAMVPDPVASANQRISLALQGSRLLYAMAYSVRPVGSRDIQWGERLDAMAREYCDALNGDPGFKATLHCGALRYSETFDQRRMSQPNESRTGGGLQMRVKPLSCWIAPRSNQDAPCAKAEVELIG